MCLYSGIIYTRIYIYIYTHIYMSIICMLVAQSCMTLCNPMDLAHQAPLSIGFSRQEHWSGWPFLSPEDLPDPGIKSRSPHHRQILYWVSREAHMYTTMHKIILASLVAQSVRNMPAMQETQVWSLGQEEPLGKEMATPQYSCLRNPTEGGAWPATVRVMSWTQCSD